MNSKSIWIFLGIVIIAGGVFLFWKNQKQDAAPASNQLSEEQMESDAEQESEADRKAMEGAEGPVVLVDSPRANSVIKTPLTFSGQAPANWFYEGEFPGKLVDADGLVMIEFSVKATGDVYKDDPVAFNQTLRFDPAETDTGKIILSTGSPSPNESQVNTFEIPIKFK